jgi:hypothetical protein
LAKRPALGRRRAALDEMVLQLSAARHDGSEHVTRDPGIGPVEDLVQVCGAPIPPLRR